MAFVAERLMAPGDAHDPDVAEAEAGLDGLALTNPIARIALFAHGGGTAGACRRDPRPAKETVRIKTIAVARTALAQRGVHPRDCVVTD